MRRVPWVASGGRSRVRCASERCCCAAAATAGTFGCVGLLKSLMLEAVTTALRIALHAHCDGDGLAALDAGQLDAAVIAQRCRELGERWPD